MWPWATSFSGPVPKATDEVLERNSSTKGVKPDLPPTQGTNEISWTIGYHYLWIAVET